MNKQPRAIEAGKPAETIFQQAGMLACLHQIKAADIALKRSQRPDVLHFARQMQNDYSDIAVKLMAFLGGLHAPHTQSHGIDPVHQVQINVLESVNDDAFDSYYITYQKTALHAALTLFIRHSEHGEGVHASKNLARLSVPALQQHMEMVHALDRGDAPDAVPV